MEGKPRTKQVSRIRRKVKKSRECKERGSVCMGCEGDVALMCLFYSRATRSKNLLGPAKRFIFQSSPISQAPAKRFIFQTSPPRAKPQQEDLFYQTSPISQAPAKRFIFQSSPILSPISEATAKGFILSN